MPQRIYLVDGTGFIFRAYFAIRGLTDSKGRPTNAVFGVARLLLRLLREHEPSHIAVVFDAPGKTFRSDLYPEYKATRPPVPEDLIAQIPLIDRLVEALGMPTLRISGVEADDVMGTLCRRAEAEGREAVLVSGDKDLLQLVSDRVRVYDLNRDEVGKWYEAGDVRERFGVDPPCVIDALALMGDASDNVPGVRGIGEKTARKLLEAYGSLDGVYAHIDELKGKQRERLEEDRDTAYLSRDLVTIKTDVPIDLSLDDLAMPPLDNARLARFFSEVEFPSLLQEFLPDATDADDTDYRCVCDEAELEAAVANMRAAGEFAVDTETTSTLPVWAELVGISMSCRAGTGFYIPVGHTAGDLSQTDPPRPADQLPLDTVRRILGPLLADPAVGKTGHNIKYDLIVLEAAGMPVAGVAFDTMVASYLTDPSRSRHNLDEVSLHYLNRKMIPIADLIGKGSKAVTFDTVPIADASRYACEDADITWRLTEVLRPKLQERGLEQLFHEVELPLISVLARMEQRGVAIDAPLFAALREEFAKNLSALNEEILELAGEPFQVNSPKQLQRILFEKIGLKPIRRTKSGYSTDVDVLEQLSLEHPLPEKVLAYRQLEKLRGTYVEALPKLVHPKTGRIHTSFNQAVAATGRLSSSDPNLQNIPIRTEEGRRIRQGFVPGKGRDGDDERRLISADYSQIELRILAHLSGDEALREAFRQNGDVHQDTAARVFGVAPEDVTSDMRRQAKAVNFGVVYGISAFGLARNLGISRADAARFIEAYFGQYPGVQTWIDKTIAEARKAGWVMTLLNRRRNMPELASRDAAARRGAERMAINTPVQGSAADIIKLAMVQLDAALAPLADVHMVLQVHDELVVEAPLDAVDEISSVMRRIMEGAVRLDVPLRVDVGVGRNWAEAH